jgi:sugar-specific transcriptional regulator TrmB
MLGKPAAQVYAALDSLSRKGAVMGTADEPRTWRPVEPGLLMQQLAVEFQLKRERAEEVLSHLRPVETDQEIYRLTTAEQVYSRTREMLTGARCAALLDCFPRPLAALRQEVEIATERGLAVGIITYGREDDSLPEGALTARSLNASAILDEVPGAILQCSVDGTEYLASLFDESGSVRAAFWTASPLVAGLAHNGLYTELGMIRFSHLLADVAPADVLSEVESELEPLLWRTSPGFKRLRE